MIEIKQLFTFTEDTTNSIINSVIEQEDKTFNLMESFDKLPTSVIFPPIENKFQGSFHYMRFPFNKSQRFHYHPKPRYLLILGNCDLYFNYSKLDISLNPNSDKSTYIVRKNTLVSLRFSKYIWHQFTTKNSLSGNVVAFSFHENDDGEVYKNGFMEELTFFYND